MDGYHIISTRLSFRLHSTTACAFSPPPALRIGHMDEMQQQELAQVRQREANLTALAAIGPRKKRKVDSPGTTPSGTEITKPSFKHPNKM
ncbi:Transcription initiation factor TFIID subunit 4 [Liparis tanakae]|uniref:Transcription initiation factor TFIID subunit 4 n=1 Tax=Liparis tanakae TaxID=230148 RepID=A0A4Z2HBQ0_9TELE|nr:Transcription initiation factor TFIID subunit 4 [Liparis tanakae]